MDLSNRLYDFGTATGLTQVGQRSFFYSVCLQNNHLPYFNDTENNSLSEYRDDFMSNVIQATIFPFSHLILYFFLRASRILFSIWDLHFSTESQ